VREESFWDTRAITEGDLFEAERIEQGNTPYEVSQAIRTWKGDWEGAHLLSRRRREGREGRLARKGSLKNGSDVGSALSAKIEKNMGIDSWDGETSIWNRKVETAPTGDTEKISLNNKGEREKKIGRGGRR